MLPGGANGCRARVQGAAIKPNQYDSQRGESQGKMQHFPPFAHGVTFFVELMELDGSPDHDQQ